MSINKKQVITLTEPREDKETLKITENSEAQIQTSQSEHQDPLVRQIDMF